MILIPQIYIRAKKTVALERTASPIYDEDPFAMASRVKDAGAEAIYIVDLSIPHVGAGENAPVIQKIGEDLGLEVFIGGAFRSVRAIESYLAMDLKMAVLETVAYQQPAFVKEACGRFPEGIAVLINVRGGRVTIPGWTVSANKTAMDYADQFGEVGVKTFFYSDVGNDGFMGNEGLTNLLNFCKRVHKRVIFAGEIKDSSDIEKLVTLGAPGLDGIVLSRSLYEGRVDLKASIAYMTDLSMDKGNEPTLTEM